MIWQAFSANPSTAHVDALFQPNARAREAAERLADREGWPPTWLEDEVKGFLAGVGRAERFLELDSLSVFAPVPDYALAVKVAALRSGADADALEDVRYLLRALNVRSDEQALRLVEPYFTERQLTPGTRELLGTLLAAGRP